MGPCRPPMRAALRRCRKGRMTGGDWREPVRTHVSLGTSMPKITGILKIYPPQRSAGGVWETRSKAEGFPHGTFQGAQRACGCGKPPNEMVWDGANSPGFSMAASRPLGWGRTCPLASVPDMPVRKVSIRRWMARLCRSRASFRRHRLQKASKACSLSRSRLLFMVCTPFPDPSGLDGRGAGPRSRNYYAPGSGAAKVGRGDGVVRTCIRDPPKSRRWRAPQKGRAARALSAA